MNPRWWAAARAALALVMIDTCPAGPAFAAASLPSANHPASPTPPPLADETQIRQTMAQRLQQHGTRDVRLHDPSSIVKCQGEYWLFATGFGLRSWRSKDLTNWVRGPGVLPKMPAWVKEVVPTQRGHFWAPDVVRHNQRYLLYYSVSQFGKNTSAIALASNPTLDPDNPDYGWIDHGVVIRSRATDDFNAIDPAILKTPDDTLWMAFGSFWSGIKLIQLNPQTGRRISPDSPIYSLANHDAIEAPCLHFHGDYYYLFLNWGICCRGVNSTYNIRVGRSRTLTGPYLDREGKNLLHGGGTLLLESDGPFVGPGHPSLFQDHGKEWFSCHFYDATDRGRSRLAIHPVTWDEEGWPVLGLAPPLTD